MGKVLYEEIPEDPPVLDHRTCLLYVLGGGDIFEQGANFQSFLYVGPLVVIGVMNRI